MTDLKNVRYTKTVALEICVFRFGVVTSIHTSEQR